MFGVCFEEPIFDVGILQDYMSRGGGAKAGYLEPVTVEAETSAAASPPRMPTPINTDDTTSAPRHSQNRVDDDVALEAAHRQHAAEQTKQCHRAVEDIGLVLIACKVDKTCVDVGAKHHTEHCAATEET